MNLQQHQPYISDQLLSTSNNQNSRPVEEAAPPIYDDVVNDGDEMASIGGHFLGGLEKSAASALKAQQTTSTTSEPIVKVGEDPVLSQPFLVKKKFFAQKNKTIKTIIPWNFFFFFF